VLYLYIVYLYLLVLLSLSCMHTESLSAVSVRLLRNLISLEAHHTWLQSA
jgi:hypothetical protein